MFGQTIWTTFQRKIENTSSEKIFLPFLKNFFLCISENETF